MAKTNPNKTVTVYGAYGHTAKFVVLELLKRGYTPILSGRDADKLHKMGIQFPGLEIRSASIDDSYSLDRAMEGAIAVINCAGPFLDTAIPVIKAALRHQVHYVDMAAEQQSVLNTYEAFGKSALDRGIVIIPAMAFFGGLADLLATAAMQDWTTVDAIDIGLALDSWMPTAGTRLTGERNGGQRLTFSNNTLVPVSHPLPSRKWQFAEPFGLQDMVGFPLTEIITLSKHSAVGEINTYINHAPMKDLHDSATPPPEAADASGRSAQVFLMDVMVRSGLQTRRAQGTGRDIYAVTAPLIVEAIIRIAQGRFKKYGVLAAGEAFDAHDFLKSLSPEHVLVELS